MTPARFPHSDTPGSTLGCQLPRAYRRLLRPSSALDAKASTMCPSQLVTHTTNPTHHHKPRKDPTRPHPHHRQKTSKAQKPITNDEPDMAVHTTHYKDARVHYPDLKQQPHTRPHPPHRQTSTEPGSWNRSPHTEAPGSRPQGGRSPDSSEPQQCAPTHRTQHPAPPHQPPHHTEPGRNVDDSTIEHHHMPHHRPPANAATGCMIRACAP